MPKNNIDVFSTISKKSVVKNLRKIDHRDCIKPVRHNYSDVKNLQPYPPISNIINASKAIELESSFNKERIGVPRRIQVNNRLIE